MDIEVVTAEEFERVLINNLRASQSRTEILGGVKHLFDSYNGEENNNITFSYDITTNTYSMRHGSVKTSFSPDEERNRVVEAYIKFSHENPHAR